MTRAEYNRIVRELDRKLVNGEITSEEYREKKLALRAMMEQDERKARDQVGADPGSNAKDKAIRRYSREIKAIYSQASEEMRRKLKEFTDKYQKTLVKKQQEKAEGKITSEQFWDWLNGQQDIMDGMKDKIDQLSGVMLNANQKAMAMVNDEMLGVFAENANWQSYQLEQDTNMDLMFSIYDENTVERLIREKPELIPRRKVNGRKDKAWNQKQIANAVTQSILQGESIPGLAERIANETAEKNGKAMLRYARTAMTGAQNSGRVEMLHRAQGLGIKVKKRWLATLDSRTRDSHQHMDGVSVGVDEEFQTPLGSKMQYPGDPNGKGGDVWNCRCTLVYDYEGFPNDPAADVRRDNETGEVIPNMTYDEWAKWKRGTQAAEGNDEPLEVDPIIAIKQKIADHKGEWSVDDLIAVGEMVAHEIDNVEGMAEINSIRTEFAECTKNLWKLYGEGRNKEYAAEYARYVELKRKKEAAESGGIGGASVLAKIREIGGVTEANVNLYADLNAYPTQRKKVKEKTIEALNHYPKAWLDASAAYVKKLKPHWTTGRAYYSAVFGEIRFDDNVQTNIHELGHRMESVMESIKRSEKEFYERRTAGLKLEWMGNGYRRDEKTRRDDFLSPYMGKDYGGNAYELVSMGFQNVLSNEADLNMRDDPEMRNWILGMLAAL